MSNNTEKFLAGDKLQHLPSERIVTYREESDAGLAICSWKVDGKEHSEPLPFDDLVRWKPRMTTAVAV